jgi:antibiotic biosynthesis monooxygenase (ABM) superfamily enzyme
MIERIVLFKLQDEHGRGAPREALAEQGKKALSALPGVRDVRVAIPTDAESSRSWDLGFFLRFDSMEDVEAYRVHPDHRAFVDELMKPRMQVVKAWNFETR